ncbi:MAG: TonB family protein [Chloroherpetonaceae bacterium]|nr:TonB family protein [Chloroherpetonaceae bacterium]
MYLRLLLFAVFTLVFCSLSFSQGRLVGRVADESNNPVAAATVYVVSPNLTQATVTNASGYFTFLDLPFGSYVLKAYKRGFPSWQKELSISAASTFRVDVRLVEKPTVIASAETKPVQKEAREAKETKPARPKEEREGKPPVLAQAPAPAAPAPAAPAPAAAQPEPKPQTVSDDDIDKEEGLRQSVQAAKDVAASDAVKPDTKPEIIGGMEALNRKIIYPAIARERGLQGGVIAKVSVDKLGFVTKVTILRSTDPSFSEEVFRVLSDDIRFKPATLNGQPVAASAVIYVEFKLQ